MPLLALIVSSETRDIDVLQEVLHELHVETEVCGTPSAAGGALVKRPVDAVLLDGDLPGAMDVIDTLARRKAMEQPRIIAILGSKETSHSAFEIGAHFVLYKPISRDRTLVSLEYAFRSAGKDRRGGGNRRGVYLNTTVSSPAVDSVPVSLFNLSPTGAAVRAKKRLPPDSKLYFEFQIPGQKATVRLAGNVVWQDVQGRAGIRFASVPASSRKALDEWLEATDREEISEPPELAMEVDRFGPMDRPGDRDPELPLVVRQTLAVPARKERRAQSRYRLNAGIRVSDQRSAVPNWCNIADISQGGCYIEMVMPFPKGTVLNLEVRAGSMRLRTQGKVQSSLPGKGMGVQFKIEDNEQRNQLGEIIDFLATGASLRQD